MAYRKAASLALSLWVAVMTFTEAHAAAAFNLTEVASGVFIHQGRQVGIDHPQRGDSANLGFIVGKKCVAVVDTGGSLATGTALRAALKRHTPLPVCYVINTHGHFDHVLGNAAFQPEHPVFVGHQNLAAVMAANREYFPQRFATELAGVGAAGVIAPTQLITGDIQLDLGGRLLQLTAQPEAHSAADLTVVDLPTGTLFAGDLVFVERLPVVDGKLRGWLAWMRDYGARHFARVIPGHGPVSAAWPAALVAQNLYLQSLMTDAKRAVADGVFLEDFIAHVDRAKLKLWKVQDAHKRNLSRAFREFEWGS